MVISHHAPQSEMGDHVRIESGKNAACVYLDKKTDIMSGYIATDRRQSSAGARVFAGVGTV